MHKYSASYLWERATDIGPDTSPLSEARLTKSPFRSLSDKNGITYANSRTEALNEKFTRSNRSYHIFVLV